MSSSVSIVAPSGEEVWGDDGTIVEVLLSSPSGSEVTPSVPEGTPSGTEGRLGSGADGKSKGSSSVGSAGQAFESVHVRIKMLRHSFRSSKEKD